MPIPPPIEKKFNAVFFFQGSSQGSDFPDGFQEGFRLGKLGADMHLQPFQMKVRKFAGRHLIKRFNAFEVHAEFIFSLAGSNVFVRSRLYVGIDANGHRSLDSHGGGNGVNGPQFRFGFHIEAINALGQGITDFLLGFSYAGISAFGRISPALRTRKSSPPETMSNPAPLRAMRFRMAMLEQALTA